MGNVDKGDCMTVIPLEDAPGNGQTSWKVKQ